MQVLPLIFTLLLILSVLSIEKLRTYQHAAIIEKEYRTHLENEVYQGMYERQSKLLKQFPEKEGQRSTRQFPFGFFYSKPTGEKAGGFRELRFVFSELIQILYGHAAFYKQLEAKRPQFVEEMMDQFCEAAYALKKSDSVKAIEEISRVKLEDPELQAAFYKMLKGTVAARVWFNAEKRAELAKHATTWAKSYPSLLTYLVHRMEIQIKMKLAPPDLLLAIYGKKEVVDKFITKRKELIKQDPPHAGDLLKQAFEGQQKPEITSQTMNFNFKLPKNN